MSPAQTCSSTCLLCSADVLLVLRTCFGCGVRHHGAALHGCNPSQATVTPIVSCRDSWPNCHVCDGTFYCRYKLPGEDWSDPYPITTAATQLETTGIQLAWINTVGHTAVRCCGSRLLACVVLAVVCRVARPLLMGESTVAIPPVCCGLACFRSHYCRWGVVPSKDSYVRLLMSPVLLCWRAALRQGTQWKFTVNATLDTVSAASYLGTTKEFAMCSNRGICNFETGLCNCFDAFGAWLCWRVCLVLSVL